MTQEELADKAGLGRPHLTRIERGNYKTIDHATFRGLAKGLGMTLDELGEAISGEQLISVPESPDQILERLRLATPVSIPVYSEMSLHAGEPVEPGGMIPFALQERGLEMDCRGC